MPKQVVQQQAAAELRCPSCGGTELAELNHNGHWYWQCVTPVTRQFGSGRNIRKLVGVPCKFWSTKEDAWQRNS